MAVENWIHECARRMLAVDDLHLDLRNYLDEIEMYANLSAGSIQSRQIVALALVNYMDRKDLRNKIEELEDRLGLDDE